MKKLKSGIILSLVVLIGILSFMIKGNLSMKKKEKKKEDVKYVTNLPDDSQIVSKEASKILRPYTDQNVKIVDNFYNYQGTEKEQEDSIISYDTTYMQNNGIIYGGVDNPFDVINIYDGLVTSVKNDKLLGNIVTVKHNERVTSIYMGLSSVDVHENDTINAGMIIGKSGESNFNKFNHLMFEMTVDGAFVNPENYYEKDINEI